MTDWFAKVPPLMPVSIAPREDKPPVFWTLCLMAVSAIGAVAFVFAMAWIILAPLGAM